MLTLRAAVMVPVWAYRPSKYTALAKWDCYNGLDGPIYIYTRQIYYADPVMQCQWSIWTNSPAKVTVLALWGSYGGLAGPI